MTFAEGLVQGLADTSMCVFNFRDHLKSFLEAAPKATYTSYLSADIDGAITQVSDMLQHQYTDTTYFALHPASRKPTWPSFDLSIWKKMTPPKSATIENVVDCALAASLSDDIDCSYCFNDSPIMGRMLNTTEKDYSFAFSALCLRTDFQKQAMDIYQDLKNKGFVKDESLVHGINLETSNPNVHRAVCLFHCYEYWSYDKLDERHGRDYHFDEPITWLAIACIRTSSNFEELLHFLTASNALGRFNEKEFDKVQRIRGVIVDHDPLAAAEMPTLKNPFGFVLPSGISENNIEDAVRNCQAHFEAMDTLREIARDPGQEVPLPDQILFGADRESLLDTNEL